MILELLYIIALMIMAYINAIVIKKDDPVKHWLNVPFHLVFWVLAGFKVGWLVAAFPFIGRLVFDVALNKFRKFPFDYVPKNPESWVDQIEFRMWGYNGVAPKVLYAALIVVINIIYVVIKF